MTKSLLALCLSLAATVPLAAQGRPLTVTGVRGLTFGTLLPGLPGTVSRSDPANSGQIDLTGEKLSNVQLSFTLPTVMTGPGGATLPLTFSSADAGYSASQAIGSQVAFDPRQPFVAALNKNGRGSVFVGGTAQPLASQRAGSYTATVILTVSYVP
ncbi:MAG TPA: DUF4402 domain-containing protein [Gemmatimonadales bacterium]|nr:DUF4402 domain-containing protein [Gemmatimonadales bacterium]